MLDNKHTSDTVGCNVGSAAGRVDSRVATVADNAHFVDGVASTGTRGREVDRVFGLDIALRRATIPILLIDTHSDTRGHIVNMLLDMGRDVVLLAGDVSVSARMMLPDIEVGDEEVLGLVHRCVELDPLRGMLGRDARYVS